MMYQIEMDQVDTFESDEEQRLPEVDLDKILPKIDVDDTSQGTTSAATSNLLQPMFSESELTCIMVPGDRGQSPLSIEIDSPTEVQFEDGDTSQATTSAATSNLVQPTSSESGATENRTILMVVPKGSSQSPLNIKIPVPKEIKIGDNDTSQATTSAAPSNLVQPTSSQSGATQMVPGDCGQSSISIKEAVSTEVQIRSSTTTQATTSTATSYLVQPSYSHIGRSQIVIKIALPNKDGNYDGNLIYVNKKQYRRILLRRHAREKLIAEGKIPKERPKYIHESRHRHARSRKRDRRGRFQVKNKK